MNDLFGQIQTALTDQAVKTISEKVGISPDKGGDVANGVVGLLFDKLAKNASSDANEAEAIQKAADQHDGGLLDDVLGAFQGGQLSEQDGSNILTHIFKGQDSQKVAESLAQETGESSSSILGMMKYLAPLALSALNKGKSQASGGFGVSDMIGLLTQSGASANGKSSISSTLITGLLDQDGDGKLGISDVISVATGQKKKKSGGLLGSLLGGLLGGSKSA